MILSNINPYWIQVFQMFVVFAWVTTGVFASFDYKNKLEIISEENNVPLLQVFGGVVMFGFLSYMLLWYKTEEEIKK